MAAGAHVALGITGWVLKSLLVWTGIAVSAGVLAWRLAKRKHRRLIAWLTVLVVISSGLYLSALRPELYAKQIEQLQHDEMTMFCSESAVQVLKAFQPAQAVTFGIGMSGYKEIESEFRRLQEQPESRVRNVRFIPVRLRTRNALPEGVFPVLRHRTETSASLSVIDGNTGEVRAYTSYVLGAAQISYSKHVGCDWAATSDPKKLETQRVVDLLSALFPPHDKGTSNGVSSSPR